MIRKCKGLTVSTTQVLNPLILKNKFIEVSFIEEDYYKETNAWKRFVLDPI